MPNRSRRQALAPVHDSNTVRPVRETRISGGTKDGHATGDISVHESKSKATADDQGEPSIDLARYNVFDCAGGGDCGPHAYNGSNVRSEAHKLRARLVAGFRQQRHQSVLGYESWEAFVLQERAEGFEGSTLEEYLTFIGPPSRAAARGNCFGVPEWEMLAQLDNKCIILFDARGAPLSRHGNPAFDRVCLLLKGKHYDRLLPSSLGMTTAGPSARGGEHKTAAKEACPRPTVEDAGPDELTKAMGKMGLSTEPASCLNF